MIMKLRESGDAGLSCGNVYVHMNIWNKLVNDL